MIPQTLPKLYRRVCRWLPGLLALAVGFFCLLYPQAALEGFSHGAKNCIGKVIPTLFPFLIVTQLTMNSPLNRFLGLPFKPYLRLLGIKSDEAAAALLLGSLGGFAVFSNALNSCYEKKEINARQASVLLIAGLNAGPAFIVSGVGYVMLGSSITGVFLLISLLISSFLCAIPFAFLSRKKSADSNIHVAQTLPDKKVDGVNAFVDAVKQASYACLSICGFIIFFNMLTQIFCRNASPMGRYLTASLLEVTTGCSYGALLPDVLRLYAVAAALSFLGLSILMQAKALLPKEVSLFPFLCSRFLHLPLSIVFFMTALHFFPELAVCASTQRFIPSLRFDWFGILSLAGMALSLIFECTPRSLFTKTKK